MLFGQLLYTKLLTLGVGVGVVVGSEEKLELELELEVRKNYKKRGTTKFERKKYKLHLQLHISSIFGKMRCKNPTLNCPIK